MFNGCRAKRVGANVVLCCSLQGSLCTTTTWICSSRTKSASGRWSTYTRMNEVLSRKHAVAAFAGCCRGELHEACVTQTSHPTKYQASFSGLVGHIACCPGALASHRQQFTTPVFEARYQDNWRRDHSPIQHINAIVCILFLCNATAAARLCNVVLPRCLVLECPYLPELHACRACRQSVRGVAFGSERAWGHEV